MSAAEKACSNLRHRTQIAAKGTIAAVLVEAVVADVAAAGSCSLIAAVAAVAVGFVVLASTSSKDCCCQC